MLTRSALEGPSGAAVHTAWLDVNVEPGAEPGAGETLADLARQFLTSGGRAQFATFTRPHRQREWLCARLAGKDAAITWWGGRGRPLTAQEVEIRTLDSGATVISPEGPAISLAHTAGIAVAVVADAPVGIDVERADRDVSRLERTLSASERDLCASHGRSPLEVLMAKESAGKSLGIGLAGSPAGFDADFDGQVWWVTTAHRPGPPLQVTITAHGVHLLAVCLGSSRE